MTDKKDDKKLTPKPVLPKIGRSTPAIGVPKIAAIPPKPGASTPTPKPAVRAPTPTPTPKPAVPAPTPTPKPAVKPRPQSITSDWGDDNEAKASGSGALPQSAASGSGALTNAAVAAADQPKAKADEPTAKADDPTAKADEPKAARADEPTANADEPKAAPPASKSGSLSPADEPKAESPASKSGSLSPASKSGSLMPATAPTTSPLQTSTTTAATDVRSDDAVKPTATPPLGTRKVPGPKAPPPPRGSRMATPPKGRPAFSFATPPTGEEIPAPAESPVVIEAQTERATPTPTPTPKPATRGGLDWAMPGSEPVAATPPPAQPITAELPTDHRVSSTEIEPLPAPPVVDKAPEPAIKPESAKADAARTSEPTKAKPAARDTEFDDEPAPASVVAKPASRRTIAIGAGIAVLLVVGVVFALGRSSKQSKQSEPAPKVATKHEAASTPPPKPGEPPTEQAAAQPPAEQPAAEQPAAEQPAAEQPPAERPPAEQPAPPTEAPAHQPTESPPAEDKKKGPFGGKKVVVEYETQATEARPVPGASPDDQKSIAKARSEYATGNQRLFAGDPGGAIRSYKRALAAYPAYVAGYRGLGLAYAQKGDNAKALQALRTYLSSAPSAKDAPLIKKRISMLQGAH